jgi:hypothetical protein
MTIRTTVATCQVEMEGSVISYLDPVRWMPEFPGYGQSGDVAFWDEDGLVLGLTETPRWEEGPLYLTLRRDDGSLTDPVEVFPGPEANDVLLPTSPDFDMVLDGGNRERPQFLLGNLARSDEIAKLAGRSGSKTQDGNTIFDLAFIVDDDRVHEADNHLLPGPGDIQDPIDDGLDYPAEGGGGFATLVRLQNHSIVSENQAIVFEGGISEFRLYNDGRASEYIERSIVPMTEENFYPGEWLNTAPVDPAVAAVYDVFVEDIYPSQTATFVSEGAIFTGTLGSWLPLSADYSWSWDVNAPGPYSQPVVFVALRVSIRKDGLILRTSTIVLASVVYSIAP